MSDAPTRPKWPWIIAGLIVAATLVAAIGGVVEVCDQLAVAVETGVEVVSVCRPAPLTDPRYVLVLIIAGLVVWQDLSEVTVGSFSMKRRIEKAESEQEALRGRVEALTQTVHTKQTTIVQVEPSYVNPQMLVAQLQEAGVLNRDESVETALTHAEAAAELLRVYERLRLFDVRVGHAPESTDFLESSGPTRKAGLWAAQVADQWPEAIGLGAAMTAEQARVFTSNFPDMLDGVRAVRNASAHGKSVADEDMKASLVVAVALEAFLLERFQHWRALDTGNLDIGPRIGPDETGQSERP